jgi:hypothetical protein
MKGHMDNLFIGNHFSPDVKVDIIKNYFHLLENILKGKAIPVRNRVRP